MLVEWERGSVQTYPQAAANTRVVGAEIARLLRLVQVICYAVVFTSNIHFMFKVLCGKLGISLLNMQQFAEYMLSRVVFSNQCLDYSQHCCCEFGCDITSP